MDWYRKQNISQKEYDDAFKEENSSKKSSATKSTENTKQDENTKNIGNTNNTEESKIEKAYREASEVRRFEIQLYWERTKYFWAFITTIYVAYYNVLTKFYVKSQCSSEFKEVFSHGHLPLLILAGLGFVFSVAWALANHGSRHWQENWENHIDLLEDKVTGPLHKIHKANASYSVSKINQFLSYIVSACALGLLIFEIVEFCKNLTFIPKILFYGILVLFAVVGVMTFVFSTKGNSDNKGNISFDRKFYA